MSFFDTAYVTGQRHVRVVVADLNVNAVVQSISLRKKRFPKCIGRTGFCYADCDGRCFNDASCECVSTSNYNGYAAMHSVCNYIFGINLLFVVTEGASLQLHPFM